MLSRTSAGRRGNGVSDGFDITPDGRTVTFISEADNHVPGDTPSDRFDEHRDVFVATITQ